jgi:hypothetical protein
MSISSDVHSIIGRPSRREFLQGMGAMGVALSSGFAFASGIPDAVKRSAALAGKNITLLNDGGFEAGAWGWQFTKGASVVKAVRHAGRPVVQVKSDSGDYARFFVLAPEAGKSYTLSGWVKTEAVVNEEEKAGAYFTATQYEFQGRPTDYTVDGKQVPQPLYGNFSGSAEWRHFSQTFTCLPTTTWFEVVVGIYRAKGTAWFSDLTFVEGDKPAGIEDVVDVWQAMAWTHEATLKKGARTKPAAAIFKDRIPVRGAASDPEQLARVLAEFYAVEFLTAEELADAARLNRAHFDLLVLPYGESFPLPAWEAVQAFLADGGDLLSTGGYAFQSPVVKQSGQWELYDKAVSRESGPNLLPEIAGSGWKSIGAGYTSKSTAALPGLGNRSAAKVEIPAGLRGQEGNWTYDFPAEGDGKQFHFSGWISASDVTPAPDGDASIGIQQVDEHGDYIYGTNIILAHIHGSEDWHHVETLTALIPTCRKLRISLGLKNATGVVTGAEFRLESRSPQVRLNTALGFPLDELQVDPRQLGMFDADFRLKRVASIRTAKGQSILGDAGEIKGAFGGYAATCVVGMNHSCWIPLLEAQDALGRKRGAAGALVYHMRGMYARGSWAFFGVDTEDLFAAGKPLGEQALKTVGRALTRKCFLHGCETELACYRGGEPVRARVLASNFGRQRAKVDVLWRITSVDDDKELFHASRQLELAPGETVPVECEWTAASFASDRYRVEARFMAAGAEIDRIESGFVAWQQKTLSQGLPFEFKQNYFQVNDKSLFLQGTDDYLHTFLSQDENPLTWFDDAQGCRDSCIDVYENLMGLRGPQQRPTETWWRWIDAMLLNVQRAGGVFFPGMLIFSNTAVSDKDLADQAAYVKAFARRYKDAAGIMYYLNGDLELHDPNLPDLQKLYNEYLRKKYGTDEALRKVWTVTPPEAPIGKLTVRSGSEQWGDVRTLDDYEFRTQIVRRWLNTLHDSIREEDRQHPVTAEFYSTPTSGIDVLSALGKLELANFGYFNIPEVDYYLFPQTCKLLDQRVRGKGLNIGEFGVKTHPAWQACPEEYIAARSEQYEQAFFLAIAHYGFALGASKIQNWCWKYPSDLPFEWGINYPNELVARDVRAVYRNTGFLFRQLSPKFEQSDVLVLIAGDNRKGGQGRPVLDGIMNGIRLLLDERICYGALSDEYLESIPAEVKTIFYPLSYCPSDAIVERLTRFVDEGGQLYLSGDISYDAQRKRTRTQRLKDLCGVEFVSERYPGIAGQRSSLKTQPKDKAWPEYLAAPGVVLRLVGAASLLDTVDGNPLVTEFQRGKGKVIYSADPIELHGDPRYQPYAHAFYQALAARLHLDGAKVLPTDAPVHRFRVPSQDERTIDVLVHYGKERALSVTLPMADGVDVKLSLGTKLSGVVVSLPGKGVQIVESSGDVMVGDKLLLKSDLHLIAIAADGEPLSTAKRMVLLPMGQGSIQIPEAKRWQRPVVLVGEIAGAHWRQGESFTPELHDGVLDISVKDGRALSMLVICESDEQKEAALQMEVLSNRPWEAK